MHTSFRFSSIGVAILLAYLILPSVVSAAMCPTLARNLSRGSSGADVAQLQQFLIERGHLAAGNATGFYGPLTEAAVKDFQCKQGITCTGSPATTGWGNIGPRTRTAIMQACGSVPPTTPSTVTLTASPISGTAPLNVTFTVNVNSSVCDSYIIDYGDGRTENIANFCGTRAFPHTYSTQGNYNARLDRYVNSGGQVVRVTQAQASISVGAVQSVVPTCTLSANRTSIQPNEAVTLTWNSTNANSATWSDGGTTGISGSAVFTNIASTTVKGINFTGPGGTKSCQVTITVSQPVVTQTGVTVTGNAIANGDIVSLASGLNSGFKLAEFALRASGTNAALLKSLLFTIRNQTSQGTGSSAKVENVRTVIGGTTYTSSTTPDGIFTDHRVNVPSNGITIPANDTLGVSILADITPQTSGTLDLWIYPEDLGLGVSGSAGTAITASSSVTNRVDPSLLYWSGWISTGNSSGGSHTLSVVPGPSMYGTRAFTFTINLDPNWSDGCSSGGAWGNSANYASGCTPLDGRPGADGTNWAWWGTPFKLLTGDGHEYPLMTSCTAYNPSLGIQQQNTTSCEIIYPYPSRGVYTARLVDVRYQCGPGATSCPGFEIARVTVDAQ